MQVKFILLERNKHTETNVCDNGICDNGIFSNVGKKFFLGKI